MSRLSSWEWRASSSSSRNDLTASLTAKRRRSARSAANVASSDGAIGARSSTHHVLPSLVVARVGPDVGAVEETGGPEHATGSKVTANETARWNAERMPRV